MLMQLPYFRIINDTVDMPDKIIQVLSEAHPDVVVHLAAQAGISYSIDNPRAYLDSNLVGVFKLLEAARAYPWHMLLASKSSVFGGNTKMPYAEAPKAGQQMSFYLATKEAIEAMAFSSAHLFDLPATMFRFFTVYGPWGRPDMAQSQFTRAMLCDEPIDVYNYWDMCRDFTYVGDLIEGIRRLIDTVPTWPADRMMPEGDSQSPVPLWREVKIGASDVVQLTDFILAIEVAIGRIVILKLMPTQPGDVPATEADAIHLQRLTKYAPRTDVCNKVTAFGDLYQEYVDA